uniref:Uncharacterized protein n=1 Tax=Onchocerca volvulus TaxID=6282 RepID=A0A8R1TRG7_ONCVO
MIITKNNANRYVFSQLHTHEIKLFTIKIHHQKRFHHQRKKLMKYLLERLFCQRKRNNYQYDMQSVTCAEL